MIIEQMEVGNFAVFTYILGCREKGEGIVVDAAADVDRILKLAEATGIRRIKYIVGTHSHADHVGGNRELKERTGAQILIHEEDAERLANPPPFILQMFQCEASPAADAYIKDGDSIEFGDQHLRVIHTPGHTPGGICLYTPGHLITGDTLFVEGIGRTDLPGGSFRVLMDSIKAKLFTLAEDTIIYPGHNYGSAPRSTIGREKRFNPFVQ